MHSEGRQTYAVVCEKKKGRRKEKSVQLLSHDSRRRRRLTSRTVPPSDMRKPTLPAHDLLPDRNERSLFTKRTPEATHLVGGEGVGGGVEEHVVFRLCRRH
jgi:hypothetical protein